MDKYLSDDAKSNFKWSDEPNKRTKIIVTTQNIDVDLLISFLVELLNIATIPVEIDIKLHPREYDRQPYEFAFKNYPNVRIIAGHESPSTFELIAIADYHASIYSTCHYEAIGLGKPTIILPFTNHEIMLPLCDQAPGCAVLARTPAEMNWIISQEHKVPTEISSYYFRQDALDNILNELHFSKDEARSKWFPV
jgi:hypothetical protein